MFAAPQLKALVGRDAGDGERGDRIQDAQSGTRAQDGDDADDADDAFSVIQTRLPHAKQRACLVARSHRASPIGSRCAAVAI